MDAGNQHWIPIERIEALIPLEPFILLAALTVGAWSFYRLFLGNISLKRHINLRKRFYKLLAFILLSAAMAGAHWAIKNSATAVDPWPRLSSYLGLFALLLEAAAVVRLAQVFLYLYLFLANMSVGVPRLIANTFTLCFATVIFGWLASEIFGVKIAPLLATSAIFSIILGLALQDTLGNFFSGVALQLDKPYTIGDWVEVQSGTQKWMGQIQEITWRATLLLSASDEQISISNKTMAQSQVVIFTHAQKPPRRSQTFRFPYDVSIPDARRALLEGLSGISQILSDPAPTVLITETNESWFTMKVFYSIEDFGVQYRVGDRVIEQIIASIARSGLKLATPTLALIQTEETALNDQS